MNSPFRKLALFGLAIAAALACSGFPPPLMEGELGFARSAAGSEGNSGPSNGDAPGPIETLSGCYDWRRTKALGLRASDAAGTYCVVVVFAHGPYWDFEISRPEDWGIAGLVGFPVHCDDTKILGRVIVPPAFGAVNPDGISGELRFLEVDERGLPTKIDLDAIVTFSRGLETFPPVVELRAEGMVIPSCF